MTRSPMPKRISSSEAYRADLAFIHDAGFGSLATAAAVELLARLHAARITDGTMIDVGCGSGIVAEAVGRAGFDVAGFDISTAMIAIARKRVPAGDFRHQSFLTADLPPCVAVAAIGEVFNYLFDSRHSDQKLWTFFRRVFRALQPGGLFLFDMASPGRGGPGGRVRNFTEGDGWACLYAAEEDPRRGTLVRDITTFRRKGGAYARDYERHCLRLYPPAEILAKLRAAGFHARKLAAYGPFTFPPGWTGFVARKRVRTP